MELFSPFAAIKNENWYSSDEDESAPNKGEKGNAIANLWNSLTQSVSRFLF